MSRQIARGWATVDLDRAAAQLRGSLAPDAVFDAVPRSELLGASCRRARGADVDWIVLLQPDTEGRLAGFLARRGEGWAATWERGVAAERGGRAGDGPFGPEVLAARGSTGDPFLLIVAAATIDT